MRISKPQNRKHHVLIFSFLALMLLQAIPALVLAQNTGSQPALNKAVQGQTAAQPEGAFLNLVNWVT